MLLTSFEADKALRGAVEKNADAFVFSDHGSDQREVWVLGFGWTSDDLGLDHGRRRGYGRRRRPPRWRKQRTIARESKRSDRNSPKRVAGRSALRRSLHRVPIQIDGCAVDIILNRIVD